MWATAQTERANRKLTKACGVHRSSAGELGCVKVCNRKRSNRQSWWMRPKCVQVTTWGQCRLMYPAVKQSLKYLLLSLVVLKWRNQNIISIKVFSALKGIILLLHWQIWSVSVELQQSCVILYSVNSYCMDIHFYYYYCHYFPQKFGVHEHNMTGTWELYSPSLHSTSRCFLTTSAGREVPSLLMN